MRLPMQDLWDFEILVEDRDGDDWMYRREPAIRRPVEKVFRPLDSMLYVAPEVQLLYKAKAPRPKDIDDFRFYWPRLGGLARDWLRDAIATAQSDFIPQLASIDVSVN